MATGQEEIQRTYDFFKHINTTALVVFAGIVALGPADSEAVSRILGTALFSLIVVVVFSLFALRNLVEKGEPGSIFLFGSTRLPVLIGRIPFYFLIFALLLLGFPLTSWGGWLLNLLR